MNHSARATEAQGMGNCIRPHPQLLDQMSVEVEAVRRYQQPISSSGKGNVQRMQGLQNAQGASQYRHPIQALGNQGTDLAKGSGCQVYFKSGKEVHLRATVVLNWMGPDRSKWADHRRRQSLRTLTRRNPLLTSRWRRGKGRKMRGSRVMEPYLLILDVVTGFTEFDSFSKIKISGTKVQKPFKYVYNPVDTKNWTTSLISEHMY